MEQRAALAAFAGGSKAVSPLRSATALQNRHGLRRFRELQTDLAEAGKGTSRHTTLIGGRKKLFEKKFS
jgi:hypothetical protein